MMRWNEVRRLNRKQMIELPPHCSIETYHPIVLVTLFQLLFLLPDLLTAGEFDEKLKQYPKPSMMVEGSPVILNGDIHRIDGNKLTIRKAGDGEHIRVLVSDRTRPNCGSAEVSSLRPQGTRPEYEQYVKTEPEAADVQIGFCTFKQGDRVNAEVDAAGLVTSLHAIGPSSSRMLKKSASGVLTSLRGSTYRSVCLASSLAAALLDGLFEHPACVRLLSQTSRPVQFRRTHGVFPQPPRPE